MPRHPPIALVSARVARGQDADLAPLCMALRERGMACEVVDWDDPAIDWSAFRLALVRSTWDYTQRLPEFLAWIERVAPLTTLVNPPRLLRWNIDKHYLADLARRGLPVVPGAFMEPGEEPAPLLAAFLAQQPEPEFVVKPTVSAGSRDTQRYPRADAGPMLAHCQRLLDAGRAVLLQPYLDRVDQQGETALLYFDGRFSHAIRKGPLLRAGLPATRALFAAEHIASRDPAPEERALAERVLAAVPFAMPMYARVDLIRAADDSPCLLELELTEPSLFFSHAARGAEALAAAVQRRLEALPRA